MGQKKKVVLGVCGSIAAFRAADLISRLREDGSEVTVVMTQDAGQFITPLTLQVLSARRVYQGMFETPESWDVDHVALAEMADLVLVAPATANVIGKIASGICDDLLTCIITATAAPVVMAPAMNEGMYTNKIVAANMEKLKGLGYHFVGPVQGRLACGKQGIGRLSDVAEITAFVKKLLK